MQNAHKRGCPFNRLLFLTRHMGHNSTANFPSWLIYQVNYNITCFVSYRSTRMSTDSSHQDQSLSMVIQENMEGTTNSLGESDQTLVKSRLPPTNADASDVLNMPAAPSSLSEISEDGRLPSSSTETTETSCELPSSVSEERDPSGQLGYGSIHNPESAQVHFRHAPGEPIATNPMAQPQDDPLLLIDAPSEQFEDTHSIRSLPHQRPNQSNVLSGPEREFQITMNQSQAGVS